MKKLILFLAAVCYAAMMQAQTLNVTYIDENGVEQTASNVTEITNASATLTGGWYVVYGADVKTGTLVCQDAVHLILADGAKLTATGKGEPDSTPGIRVTGDGNSLTIYGQTNQSGQLEANGGYSTAGIGGGDYESGSNITINGGTITANGGYWAAGIGGGDHGSGSNITINGGNVTANGEEFAAGIGGGDSKEGFNITINGGNVTATGINGGAGIGGGAFGSGFNITINGGTVTANREKDASCIGGGYNADGSNIRVATTLLLKADGNNPPTEEIEHGDGDIAGKLAGKRYATIVSILPFRDAALAAINAAVGDVTNENIMYFITPSKKNIEAATTTNAINSIKEKALTDLQNALAIYDAGKTDGFGTLGEKQNGPAVKVTGKGNKEIILYAPKKVEYIKVNE